MTLPTVTPGALTLCCADLDARPLFSTDPDGSRHGYEPEAAELAARELGLELVWIFRRWADFVPSLERRECDAVWCGQAITPTRRERVDFTRPYATFDESVIVRSENEAAAPAGLEGQRVGAITGSTNMALAETFGDVELVPFDGTSDDVFAEMIGALRDGHVDAIVDDEPALIPLAGGDGLRIAFTVPTRNAWGAALRKNETELRDALDGALTRLTIDGRLESAWLRWLPELGFPLA